MSKTQVFRPGARRLTAAAILSGVALLSAAACTSSSSTPVAQGTSTRSTTSAAASPSTSTPPVTSLPSATASTGLSTATGTSAASADAVTPQCGNADLQIAWGYGSQSEPEQYTAIDFVNVSNHTCTLYGYPGLAIKVDGTTIDAARALNGAEPPLKTPPLVTLKPGAKAYAIAQ